MTRSMQPSRLTKALLETADNMRAAGCSELVLT